MPARAAILRIAPWLLAAGLVAAGAAAESHGETAAEILAQQPEHVVKRLLEDRVVILRRSPEQVAANDFVHALVLFAQPRRRALRLLSQTARQSEFRPELKRVRALEWTDSTTLDEHRLKIMFMKIDYRLRTHFDFEAGRIWWELDPRFRNDLKDVEGFWELYALDEGSTLGRFGTRVDVGPALPIWLQDYATRRNLPKTMERVRLWVDSGGRYRP